MLSDILTNHDDLILKSNKYLKNAYEFIDSNKHEWKLNNDVDLEVVNHVLRLRAQNNSVLLFIDDVIDLCNCQNSDGGWGNTRDDLNSKVRSTAFSIQMLIRTNRVLNNDKVSQSITDGLNFVLSNQQADGSWADPTWHHYDAASVSIGTLLFAVNENMHDNNKYKTSLEKGIKYIKSQRYSDGLWYYKKSGSPVTITAHLLPKCVTFEGASDVDKMSVRNLIALQDPEGQWDDCNTDHTCDAIRAMMLTAGKADSKELFIDVYNSSIKALSWLINVSEDIGKGLGDKPGRPAHVERTCDGVDAILKFHQFIEKPKNMVKFWS